MPNLLSWLRPGGPANGTTLTASRSRMHDIIDISNDDEADPDDIVAQPRRPSNKRKIIDISRDDADDGAASRPRKMAKTAQRTTPRASHPIVDISKSDGEDDLQTTGIRKRQTRASTKRLTKHTSTSAGSARSNGVQQWLNAGTSTQSREVFRELDATQFQNRLRGPVAWCKRPVYNVPFLAQFAPDGITRMISTAAIRDRNSTSVARMSTPARAPHTNSKLASGQAIANGIEETVSAKRPQRASARHSYRPAAYLDEESEDELAAPPGNKRARRSRVIESDASDFEMPDTESEAYATEAEASATESEASATESEASATESDSRVDNANNVLMRAAKALKSETSKNKTSNSKGKAQRMKKLFKNGQGLNQDLAPCSDIHDIFADITDKAHSLGLVEALQHLQSRPIRVATMCSGTESPLLALQMIEDALQGLSPSSSNRIHVEHLFSAEIVPFKQAYIERNFKPPIIFRDITELTNAFDSQDPVATTAYGAKVSIPRDLDMVIAGTSCVDFSGQNSRKKGLHDGGESGDTWSAVLAFCEAARPGIVLLENVSGAPWDSMLAEYEEIGYDCSGVLIDTKDFYLPQTRQRGYMVAFDKQKLAQAANTTGAAAKWQTLMEKFKRPASSPVSSFLLPSDLVKPQAYRNDEVFREIDWSTCEITQMQYRQETRLGDGRPVTSWTVTGYSQPPDYSHRLWFRALVERVKDTIDAAVLRKALQANGMYDLTFKLRIIDLSQNVYRETDGRPFGIIGCITPTGMFYLSNRGRALAAEELLQLQGLPLHKISFTTETPSQIQDLAGNAMSTTTIGCAIVSALIAGHKTVPDRTQNSTSLESATAQNLQPTTNASMLTSPVVSIKATDTAAMKRRAKQAMRRCYCESSTGMTSKSIQQCKDCGHTTCTTCGGKPVHNYETRPLLSSDRLHPAVFEKDLRSLPLQMKVNDSPNALSNSLVDIKHLPPCYLKELYAALTETFSFQKVRRTHCWTVTYLSTSLNSSARLELVIEEDNAEWRLYAHTPAELAVNSPLRSMLRQPVARTPVQNDICGEHMLVRAPSEHASALRIVGSGQKVASWWNRNGMPDFANHCIWERLSITVEKAIDSDLDAALSGEYRYLPECGTAAACLYVKLDPRSSLPLYLFLDPTSTGNPDEDRFVFSRNIARLEDDEVRPILAAIAPPWRAYSAKGGCIAESTTARLVVENTWHKLDRTLKAIEPAIKIFGAGDMTMHHKSPSCSHAVTLLRAESSCDSQSVSKSGVIRDVDVRFLRAHAATFEAMARALPSGSWEPLALKQGRCFSCAPAKAPVLWGLSASGTVKPYEDPEDAASYERAIKDRSSALEISSLVEDDRMKLDLSINVMTLAHRAAASLPEADLERSAQWRLSSMTTPTEAAKAVSPFILEETTCVRRCDDAGPLTVKLFPKQLEVLSWMKHQDAHGLSFDLEEAAEESIPALNIRLEVRATQAIQVRGGFCADHPGFGKTVTSLALIYSHLEDTGRASIVSDLKSRQTGQASGLIPTAATLIICPSSLVKQWVQEITEKAKQPGKVLAISTVADLAKHTIEDFEKAAIVVVNRSLYSGETYTERLASFAAIPGPADTSGRSYAQWLTHATTVIPDHLRRLRPSGQTTGIADLRRDLKTTYRANVRSDQFQRHVPSKRLRGANYVAAKAKGKTTLKAATAEVDTSHVGEPLFEMFFFNRVIVDESHLLCAKERVAIVGLQADKRWALSATPDLGDCYSIAQMAALLGIKLRSGRLARGDLKKSSFNELNKEMTSFELFDSMRQPPSDAMQARIHEKAQEFLSAFVRRNIMDYNDQLNLHEHLVPVQLGVTHMAMYKEVSQHVNSMDMRIKKSKSDHDRQRRLNAVIDDCSTAEEALLRTAAHYDGTLDLDAIVQQRRDEVVTALEDLRAKTADAQRSEPAVYASWQERLDAGSLGDESVTKMVQTTIARTKPSLKASKAASSSDEPPTGKKRAQTAAVNALCNRVLAAERSARYLSNLSSITEAARRGDDMAEERCANTSCDHNASPLDYAVSASCGHAICRTCFESMKSRAIYHCPASGCCSSMHNTDLLWADNVSDLRDSKVEPFGAKIEATLSILHKVEERDEQAILFVQFESQLAEIKKALKDRKISASVVDTPASAGAQIADFRETADTDNRKTVLVLNASDETAAGSNLQNANHVIFLSPLLRETQYGYESTMKQAIGRVRRFGQKKEIHIYRLVALHTIDVDILEHRETRVDALVQQDSDEIPQPRAIKTLGMRGDVQAERVQLVREHGAFSLRPHSWLLCCGSDNAREISSVFGKKRISGWEDFSSLVKFGKTYADHGE